MTCSRMIFSNTPPYAATVSGVRCWAMAGRASASAAAAPMTRRRFLAGSAAKLARPTVEDGVALGQDFLPGHFGDGIDVVFAEHEAVFFFRGEFAVSVGRAVQALGEGGLHGDAEHRGAPGDGAGAVGG